MIRIFAFRDARKTDPKMVTLSLTLVSSLTFLEVITASDPTSADTYTPKPQPPFTPPRPPPSFKPLMDHSTHKHTHRRGFFFLLLSSSASHLLKQETSVSTPLPPPLGPIFPFSFCIYFFIISSLTFIALLPLYVNFPPPFLSHSSLVEYYTRTWFKCYKDSQFISCT